MKSVLITLVLLAGSLAGHVSAADWFEGTGATSIYTDTIVITELPYTIDDSSYQLYTLSGDLHGDSCGIFINRSDHIRIEGGGDSIVFDCDHTGFCWGMKVRRSDYIVLNELIIVQDSTAACDSGSFGGMHCVGLSIVDNDDMYIKDCEIHARGHSSPSVWAGYDVSYPQIWYWDDLTWSYIWGYENYSNDIEVDGGNFTSYSNSFDSRSNNDGCAAYFSVTDVGVGVAMLCFCFQVVH